MEVKELRRRMATLTMDINDIDDTVEQLNDLLERMVADNVTSEVGQIMVLFNPQENIYVQSAAPLVLAQQAPPPGEETEPLQMMGMNISLADPVLYEETRSSAITLDNGMLIRLLSFMKKDLIKE